MVECLYKNSEQHHFCKNKKKLHHKCSTVFQIRLCLLFQKKKQIILYEKLKTLSPFLWMGFNCLKPTEPLGGDSSLFTTMFKGIPKQ